MDAISRAILGGVHMTIGKHKPKKMRCKTTKLTGFTYKKVYDLQDKLGDSIALKNNEGKTEWVPSNLFEKE